MRRARRNARAASRTRPARSRGPGERGPPPGEPKPGKAGDGILELARGRCGVAAGCGDTAGEQGRLGAQILASESSATPRRRSAAAAALSTSPAERATAARNTSSSPSPPPAPARRSSSACASSWSPRCRCSRTSGASATGSSSRPRSSCSASSMRPWRRRSPARTDSGSERPPPRRRSGWPSQRLRKHRLGSLPFAGADEDGAEDAATPRLKGRIASALGELDDRVAPLRGALQVGEAVADDERRAACVTTGQRVARLAAERDCHRLVEQRHALLDTALEHDGAAELGQSHALDIGVVELVGDAQRGTRVLLRGRGVARALGLLDREPAELRDRALAGEQAPRPRQPPGRRRVLAVDAMLPRQIDRQAPRVTGVVAALVRRIRLAATVDRRLALTEPPERLTQAVERVGIARVLLEARRERITRGCPVGVLEVLPGGLVVAHPDEQYRGLTPSYARPSASMRATSASSNSKPKTSKLAAIRAGSVDFGITGVPRWMCQRTTTCRVVTS